MDQALRIDLDWDVTHSRIQLRIAGYLDEDEGVAGAARLLELAGNDSFELVADLEHMSGYDRKSRESWQRAFIGIRSQMTAVHFVGLRPVFRMAAATVCLAARIKAHFYDSADAIPAPGSEAARAAQ